MAVVAGVLAGAVSMAAVDPAAAKPGDTQVLKWRDGKQAAFLMAFDDSCVSHVQNAIPELKKRGYVGTFYINAGNGPFKARQSAWEQELPGNPAVEYGNHTFKHAGATNATQLDVELAQANEVIRKCFPDRPWPRLVSFGQPGGVPWTVSKEEKQAALAKYHLIDRPPFWGAAIHVKTPAQMEALVDKAITQGEIGHLDFHGVGGDWLAADMPFFTAFLDKLDACRDKLWVTDAISYHKYQAERKAAEVKVLAAGQDQIRVQLAATTDPALYDLPLTLETVVPATWQVCTVMQGKASAQATAANGVLRYAATPGAGEIVIRAAGSR